MWDQIKKYSIAFVAGLGSVLALVLLFKKSDDVKELERKDLEIEKKKAELDKAIDDIKKDIEDVKETELSPSEVEDYWNTED